jgi:hypothetical protein
LKTLVEHLYYKYPNYSRLLYLLFLKMPDWCNHTDVMWWHETVSATSKSHLTASRSACIKHVQPAETSGDWIGTTANWNQNREFFRASNALADLLSWWTVSVVYVFLLASCKTLHI